MVAHDFSNFLAWLCHLGAASVRRKRYEFAAQLHQEGLLQGWQLSRRWFSIRRGLLWTLEESNKSLSIDAFLKLSFLLICILRTRIRTSKTRLETHLVQCTTETNSAVLFARNEHQPIWGQKTCSHEDILWVFMVTHLWCFSAGAKRRPEHKRPGHRLIPRLIP